MMLTRDYEVVGEWTHWHGYSVFSNCRVFVSSVYIPEDEILMTAVCSIEPRLVDQDSDRGLDKEFRLLMREPSPLHNLSNCGFLLFLVAHDRQKSMQPDLGINLEILSVFQIEVKIVFHSLFPFYVKVRKLYPHGDVKTLYL